ncbi:MAG: nucleoside transporter C-terminal domain-containing protein [Tepidisphaeraceae bacterium]
MMLSSAPAVLAGTLLERGHAALGLVAFLFIAHLIGRFYSGAKQVPWRVLIWGIVLAFAFGGIVLYAPGVLTNVQEAIQKLLDFTLTGSKLVFGDLANSAGVTVLDGPATNNTSKAVGHFANTGAVVAFIVLPTIIFVSMLTAILYRLHVLGWVVSGLAWVMRRTMGTSGAETLSTAANIFVGQTEAPLIVRPFLAAATRSELMAIMVGGFANIASGVLVVYTEFLKDYVANAGGHLAAACFVSAPATLMVAKLILPETETPVTADAAQRPADELVEEPAEQIDANLIDAATRGTSEGLALAINVGAMLLAFTALVALINAVLGWVFGKVGIAGVTLESILGYVCAGRLAVRDPVARLPEGRQPAGHQDGAERVRCLQADERPVSRECRFPRPAQRPAGDVRAVRLCEHRQHRHTDRRHQRDGAEPPPRTRQARRRRHDRRGDRQLYRRVRHRRARINRPGTGRFSGPVLLGLICVEVRATEVARAGASCYSVLRQIRTGDE